MKIPMLFLPLVASCYLSLAFATDAPVKLWPEDKPVPAAAELPRLEGVRFHVIKAHEPQRDGGYTFLHGVALVWHKERLYASFGHNKGIENTATEEARGRFSDDGGRTWSEVFTIDAGDRKTGLAVSHGVFHKRGNELWALMGAFYGNRENVHTRAYVLDEATGRWIFRDVIVRNGFWPMQQPVKMEDGNWIMAGIRVGGENPAAVAISRGDDRMHWDLVVIPPPDGRRMWGESTVIVEGRRIINIARFGEEAKALVALSEDYGRTWTPSHPNNLPMTTSKPYAGTLSNGQRYLICTTTRDSGSRRTPLTIAISRPGETLFSRILRIRDADFPQGPGESHPQGKLPYPYAIEHEGYLYVGYSNSGGRPGMNINSAELAVIPLSALRTGESGN